MTLPKLFNQGADVIRLDAALEPFDAIHGNHRNTIAITLEDRRVAPDIHLVEGEMEVGNEVFQMHPRVVAQMATGLSIEQDDGFHVRFFQAAYRSDSGMASSGG
jgi:hypothetical protein